MDDDSEQPTTPILDGNHLFSYEPSPTLHYTTLQLDSLSHSLSIDRSIVSKDKYLSAGLLSFGCPQVAAISRIIRVLTPKQKPL